MKTYELTTHASKEFINIDSLLNKFIEEEKVKDGVVMCYTPHTTSSITINENADPDVLTDLLFAFNKLSPKRSEYRHAEGNSDSHLLCSMVGCSELIIVENSKPVLGTWQSLYFFEEDGPRVRKVIFKKL